MRFPSDEQGVLLDIRVFYLIPYLVRILKNYFTIFKVEVELEVERNENDVI